MKIRFRLSVWAFFVTLLVLIVFSLGTYFAMQHILFKALDNELDIILDDVQTSYNPQTYIFEYLDEDMALVNRHLRQYYLKVYNSIGESIYSSTLAEAFNLEVSLPRNQREVSSTIEIHSSAITNLRIANVDDESGEFTVHIVARQLLYQGDIVGYAVLAIPVEDIKTSLNHLLEILVLAGIATILLIGFGSYIITEKALEPVAEITKKARNISHTNLNQRLPVIHPDDELGQLSQVLNDLLQRLQMAFRSQQQFLSDAAHELKTPLSILRTHWEGEINNPELPIPIKEKIIQDIETITRLNQMVNNLLLLARTENIESSFEFKEINLDKILQDVIADAEVLADLKEQTLTIEQTLPVLIKGDKIRLYQLFFNLIENAIKYTPEKGVITISLESDEETATFTVRDTGQGIPHEHLPHIFDRFYRVHQDRSRSTGGSGLGLSICKLIVEAHKGKMDVQSEVNRGTVIYVRLPLHNSVPEYGA